MINTSISPAIRYFLSALLASFLLLSFQQVSAKDIPWDDSIYTHYSDQEPLRSFLEALATSQKTPIIISDKIDTVISGYYKQQPPKDIFLEVVRSNGLVWYYDGDTLFIAREDEMQTGSVSLSKISASEFTNSLERLGILDHHYQWVTSDVDSMVYFKGPEQFVTAVLEMSKVIDKNGRPNIYQWVDKKGVTNFSSEMPAHYKNKTEYKIINKNKGVVVLDEPRVQ